MRRSCSRLLEARPRPRQQCSGLRPRRGFYPTTTRNFLALVILVNAGVLLAGCTARSVREGVSDPGPIVQPSPLPRADRLRVAIGRFSNETTYGLGLYRDEYGDPVGKQASDLLARHLVKTQRFVVLERPDLGRVDLEARLSSPQGRTDTKAIPADALILGSVVELGRDTTGNSWLVGRSKTQRARARVVIRMVDPRTGEVFYAQEGSGEATLGTSSTFGFGAGSGYDSTLAGKAIDAAIVNMMNNIVRTLDARSQQLRG